jgi:hypothetical protein
MQNSSYELRESAGEYSAIKFMNQSQNAVSKNSNLIGKNSSVNNIYTFKNIISL